MSKIEQIVERFTRHSDWEDRYRELIKIARNLEPLDESFQTEKYRIKGCQSQVWLVPELREGKLHFKADSDATLVKGIAALLVEAFSGLTPEQVIENDADFLRQIGITQHLSMNRTNGLANMLKQIKMYGVAFKTLTEKGVENVAATK